MRVVSSFIFAVNCIFVSGLRLADVPFHDVHQAELVNHLPDYDVVLPRKVTSEGHLISHNVVHHYSASEQRQRSQRSNRRRRHVDSSSDSDGSVHFRLDVAGQERHLHLRPNENLLAPAFVVERYGRASGRRRRSVAQRRLVPSGDQQCHYIGHIRGHPQSTVAISTCHGLTGYVTIGDQHYLIEPIKGHNGSTDHPHLIYKRSALAPFIKGEEEQPVKDQEHQEHQEQQQQQQRLQQHHKTCASEDSVVETLRQREKWESFVNTSAFTSRRKRSVSVERNVETLVVADRKMTEFYSNEDIETYILTVMNMVSALYRDASIGNAINIVMVRLMLLDDESIEDQEGLDISHHADNTLKSFCKWQAAINPGDDNHPNHHDVAILLTRYNICTRMNEPCSTLGLAEVAGMCQSYRSCSVNEDTGLSLAYTVAHELGHNFGASHDGAANGCEAASGDAQHVMSPQLSSDAGPIIWSNCSRRDITKFLDHNWGMCLEDRPSDHEFQYPRLPPGAMYNVDHQCRLQYGPDAQHCAGMDEVCQTLWCKLSDNRCVTRLEPAAPGTTCGKHKWCENGQCVEMGEQPEAIDGEWGEWGPWSQCTRTCGAGLYSSARSCDNPAPAHGGKYCVGERRRYRVCNTNECEPDGPSYRAVQCSSYDHVPYKGENHTWLPVQVKSAPCQLHCKPQGHFFSVMLSDSVIDGTPCNPGTRDMCINGVCRRVACDWGIDSAAQEDRCGLCHGDGTQCNTIRGLYSEPEGVDYVEMVVIPKGARNIRFEEVEEAANYIAIQSETTNEYYLNGQWTVQWTGEYRAGVTLIYYRREGEQEEVHIPGPSLENLRFLLLFRTENPGVKYSYTVANENITRKPEFRWEYMDWSVCTATCGGGTQLSQPKCMEIEAGLVQETYCAHIDKPQEKSRPCNKQSCPARWWVGPWQYCSLTCGEKGIRRRTVICVRSLSDDEQVALHDADCPANDRPTEEDLCPDMPPCPGQVTWKAGPWSKCSEDPCDMKRREVECSVPGGSCAEALKPPEERQCGNIVCGTWNAGNWSECSASCGDGVQFRRVSCLGGMKCRDASEPESIQQCRNACADWSTPTPEITNDILDNDILAEKEEEEAKKEEAEEEKRPDYMVEDKLSVDDIQVVEMQNVTVDPAEMDSNDIKLSDEGFKSNSNAKKMSIHVGEDAIHFLETLQKLDNVDDDQQAIDVSKIKPDFNWKIGLWTKCSVQCDGGTRVRDVSCYELTTSTLVDDALCTDDKPEDVESCNENRCIDWVLTSWSPCSVTCGQGIKTREVRCPEEDKCNPNTKPNEEFKCNERPCIDWVPGPWTSCSATCGGGHQLRGVQCMDRRSATPVDGCEHIVKPRQRQRCAVKSCPRSNRRHVQNHQGRLSACHDKLDTKLCATLKHMCGTWYFKVKCCSTCRKHSRQPQSRPSLL